MEITIKDTDRVKRTGIIVGKNIVIPLATYQRLSKRYDAVKIEKKKIENQCMEINRASIASANIRIHDMRKCITFDLQLLLKKIDNNPNTDLKAANFNRDCITKKIKELIDKYYVYSPQNESILNC